MNIETNADIIMKKFAAFTDGVRVQMLVDRGTGKAGGGSERWINKLISTNTEQFRINLEKLLVQQSRIKKQEDVRLYFIAA
jgi:hypothetical protein